LTPTVELLLSKLKQKFSPPTHQNVHPPKGIEIFSNHRLYGAIFCEPASSLNRFFPAPHSCRSQFEVELRLLAMALCNLRKQPSVSFFVSKRILQGIPSLAWKYTKRLLRKHILWKHVFLLLRERNHLVYQTIFLHAPNVSVEGVCFLEQQTKNDTAKDGHEEEEE
jgi:hypothetical protein